MTQESYQCSCELKSKSWWLPLWPYVGRFSSADGRVFLRTLPGFLRPTIMMAIVVEVKIYLRTTSNAIGINKYRYNTNQTNFFFSWRSPTSSSTGTFCRGEIARCMCETSHRLNYLWEWNFQFLHLHDDLVTFIARKFLGDLCLLCR